MFQQFISPMKRKLILILLLGMTACLQPCLQLSAKEYPQLYSGYFKEAYQFYPDLPKGILEAVAYTNTRMNHIVPQSMQPGCMDMPQVYGVMGLVADGKGYFRNNLAVVSKLSGTEIRQICQSPQFSILAYAAAFDKVMQLKKTEKITDIPAQIFALIALSELPYSPETYRTDFALNSFLYSVLYFFNEPNFREQYGIDSDRVNIRHVLGEAMYRLVCAPFLDLSGEMKTGYSGLQKSNLSTTPDVPETAGWSGSNCTMPSGPAEYSNALWNPANSANYSSYSITPYTIAVHTVQGSYSGCISWFQNPSASVSAHYVIRSFDGQVTQMVCHRNRAWHVGSQNSFAVGIEHEGWIEQGTTWYTNALYQSSAMVSRFISDDLGINKLQTYDGPPTDGLLPLSHSCYKIKGHQHYIENTHTDPGPQWNWYRYYQLLNDLPPPTLYTSLTGTVYDSGGPSGNYGNEERSTYLIQPSGATSISLNFTTYSLENGWDYLWIYDGNSPNNALIGVFSGTSPGIITAYTGAVYLEFRSDCSTTAPGWAATYTASVTPPGCPPPTGLLANAFALNAQLSWSPVDEATGYEVDIKRDLDNLWMTYSTGIPSLSVSGLIAGSVYQWRVRADCGTDYSGYAGSSFVSSDIGTTTTSTGSYVNNQCEGTFLDSGGQIANYAHNENWTYTIAPENAATVTLVFSQFDTEAGYDFLNIYDGSSVAAPLIGSYSGTTSPGTITSSGGALTIRFTSDGSVYQSGWAANWTCQINCMLITEVNIPASLWQTDDFTATFTDLNPCETPITERFYNATGLNGNEWRGNPLAGQLKDDFNQSVIHPDWTPATGIWSMNTGSGSIQQTDETNGNTKIYTALTQTSGKTWLYHWRGRIGGSGNNRRAGIHFFGSDANGANLGNSYFVYFRADNDKAQIYRVNNDVWSLQTDNDVVIDPNIWYDFKITYNPLTGVINAYVNNTLVSSWTDPSPYISGSYVSLRTGNCTAFYDFLQVFCSRPDNSVVVSVGNAPSDALNQQNPNSNQEAGKITSIIRDLNGWSNESSTLVNIDFTPPIPVMVNDGSGADSDFTDSATQLSANWTSTVDSHSDITGYFYAIGSLPGSTDLLDWTFNGMATNFTQSGLDLLDGQTCFINIRAVNGAGLFSMSSSDGITIQLPCTSPQNLNITDLSPTSVQVNWQSVENAVQYNLQYQPVGEATWSNLIIPENMTTTVLNNLSPCTEYEIQIQAVCIAQTSAFSNSVEFTTGNYLYPIIYGSTDICLPAGTQIYTATFYPNVSYSWTVTGGAILTGQGTHQITVQWSGTEAGQVSLVVTE